MAIKKVLVFIVLYIVLSLEGYSSGVGTSVFPMLKINPAARTAGMGDVIGIISSQSLLSSPAALSWIGEKEVSVQHLMYLSQINYSLLTYVSPVGKKGALYGSVGWLSAGSLIETQYDSSSADNYQEVGSFNASDLLINMGYGWNVSGDFAFGVSLKAIQESIDSKSNFGVMISAGGFYIPGYSNQQISFGFFNVGPKVKDFSLPAGGYLCLGNYLTPKLFSVVETAGYSDKRVELRAGFEYFIVDVLAFRVGYKYHLGDDQKLGSFPSVGLTGGVGFSAKNLTFDYAWVPCGDLGNTHRITIGSKFGKM